MREFPTPTKDKNVPTTNTVEPQRPTYPEPKDRKHAKGPLISTSNIDEIRKANAKDKKGKK